MRVIIGFHNQSSYTEYEIFHFGFGAFRGRWIRPEGWLHVLAALHGGLSDWGPIARDWNHSRWAPYILYFIVHSFRLTRIDTSRKIKILRTPVKGLELTWILIVAGKKVIFVPHTESFEPGPRVFFHGGTVVYEVGGFGSRPPGPYRIDTEWWPF